MSTLTFSGLVIDLKASLLDAAEKFTTVADLDFKRHLDMAVADLARVKPRTVSAQITLVADQAFYAAPADLMSPKFGRWGEAARRSYNYWDDLYPKTLPTLRAVERNGVRMVELDPPPTAAQIALLGSTYEYFYYGAHALSDTPASTTIADYDRGLLLLRAQAEAMKELAHRGVGKPVQLRDGMTASPKNGTPAALYDQLMREFEKQAA